MPWCRKFNAPLALLRNFIFTWIDAKFPAGARLSSLPGLAAVPFGQFGAVQTAGRPWTGFCVEGARVPASISVHVR
jgi:hypothetical protein